MGGPFIWGELPKSLLNNQKIDEAIDAALDVHNDDPAAHLDVGQALQSHKASEIIDHVAESVVNDKLRASARTYIAIVDPSSISDFDTIQGAVIYALTKGGGTIYLVPGTHYLSGVCEIDPSINFVGADAENTIIAGDYAGGDYISIAPGSAPIQKDMYFENIGFTSTGGSTISCNDVSVPDYVNIRFINCRFKGGYTYVQGFGQYWFFTGCYFECNATNALQIEPYINIYDCTITQAGAGTTVHFLSNDPTNGDVLTIFLFKSYFMGVAATVRKYINTPDIDDFTALYCSLLTWDTSPITGVLGRLEFNLITLKSTVALTVPTGVSGARWVGNQITGGLTPNVVVDGNNSLVIANILNAKPTNSGTGNIIKFNSPDEMYKVAGTADTAMVFGLRNTVKLTPNSTRTLTTTVPFAGETRQLIILTSGTTSYTLTFGTGFKTTGTLATGIVSSRVFVVDFVSDGSNLYEVSRTAAMVA